MASLTAAEQAESLARLTWVPLRFRVRFTTSAWLPPYKGATLRGGFGAALRRATCLRRGIDCRDCGLESVCAYRYVFDSPVPAASARMRRYPYCPHPFVLEPPADERRAYSPGDELEFGLTLVGKAASYAPHVIWAVTVLGEDLGLGRRRPPAAAGEAGESRGGAAGAEADASPGGLFEVVAVADGAEDAAGPLYDPASGRLLREAAARPLVETASWPSAAGAVRLRLLTPMRVVEAGGLSGRPSFAGIARALLRRLSSLAYFHCGVELDLPFREMVERAATVVTAWERLAWHDWERYSRRQRTRMRLGGVVGEVIFTGELAPFLPLLRAGEAVHAGKATSFGLGAYEMEVDGGGR